MTGRKRRFGSNLNKPTQPFLAGSVYLIHCDTTIYALYANWINNLVLYKCHPPLEHLCIRSTTLIGLSESIDALLRSN